MVGRFCVSVPIFEFLQWSRQISNVDMINSFFFFFFFNFVYFTRLKISSNKLDIIIVNTLCSNTVIFRRVMLTIVHEKISQ